jgi:hypothetical protein
MISFDSIVDVLLAEFMCLEAPPLMLRWQSMQQRFEDALFKLSASVLARYLIEMMYHNGKRALGCNT